MSDSGLGDLPVAAKYVHHVLDGADDRLTQKQLIERTELDPRTVRRALDRLDERDLIEYRPKLDDARQTFYWLA